MKKQAGISFKFIKISKIIILCILLASFITGCQQSTIDQDDDSKSDTSTEPGRSDDYTVVGTGQSKCYDDTKEIDCSEPGEAFYGQNAQFPGVKASYQDNDNGTITDKNTGLIWQKEADLDNKSTFAEAVSGAKDLDLAGHNDWRLPTIKELYSLINFSGSGRLERPYIDTKFFNFRFGDESLGERTIDGQYWSSTEYVGTTMKGDATVFGVNFADGRIKGYPKEKGSGGSPFTAFVRYVRDNKDYGKNDFVDNGDDTITDKATGLMWQKGDDGKTRNWEEALAFAENLQLGGHDDWRLPNAKELQSIVDYSKAPDASDESKKGPAIDTTFFDITEEESWFWTNTTLLEAPSDAPGSEAVYITFGQAFGFAPNDKSNLINVHGAGSQRSDPKSGASEEFEGGRGPQGDEIRIQNYVRAVRGNSGK